MPAPAPAPAGVTIVDTGPPAPPPKPTASIPATSIAPPATPTPTPKAGSAMARMREELQKRAKPAPAEPGNAPQPPPQAEPPSATQDAPEPGSTSPEPGSPEQPAAPDPGKPAKGEKVSPWKLVEQYKGKLAGLEKELAEMKTGGIPEKAKNEYLTQIEQLQKRNTELEDEVRFTSFSKSKEFADKYQAPYEAAWKRAMSEMSEITLTDPASGQARPVTAEDLLTLVNLPLGKAREIADQAFGVFADDVMAHRKEIRQLFEAQSAALEEAKKTGAAREKQQAELRQKQMADMAQSVKKTWDESNESALKHPDYGRFFTPTDGDQDGNQRLAKGFELVDRAFQENPMDPSLTPEQRASIVKRHSVVRLRAAAFGRLTYLLKKAESETAALRKELEGIKGSAPSTGSQPAPASTPQPSTAREAVFADLRRRAK